MPFSQRSMSWLIIRWLLCVSTAWRDQALNFTEGLALNVTNEENCKRTTTLICQGRSDSPLDCSKYCDWYRDGIIILRNGTAEIPNKYEQRIGVNNITLVIYNIDFSDNGRYRCSVGTKQSNYVALRIGLNLTVTKAVSCSGVTTLLCEANSDTQPDSRDCNWYKYNGHTFTVEMLTTLKSNKYEERVGVNNCSLMIHKTDISDDGKYYCSIGKEQSNYICLDIECLALIATKEENCKRTTTLICQGRSDSPLDCSKYCDWYKDDVIILRNGTAEIPNKYEQRIGVNNITLVIYNTDFSDNGRYRCSVGTNQSNYAALRIGLKLTVTTSKSCDRVTMLSCEANPNTPLDSSHDCNWYKDNVPIFRNGMLPSNNNKYKRRVRVNNFSLLIYNSDISDNGKYYCRVGEEKSNYICLDIESNQAKIVFLPNKSIYINEENTQLPDIQCDVDCTPPCNYTWIETGRKTTVSNTNLLSIRSVNRTNAGTYTCIAENYFSCVTGNITIDILYGPEFLLMSPIQTSYTLKEGDVVPSITCSANCYPNCTYMWTNNRNTPISHSWNGTISLGRLQRQDAGQYTCTATNPARNDSANMDESIHITILDSENSQSYTMYITGGTGGGVTVIVVVIAYFLQSAYKKWKSGEANMEHNEEHVKDESTNIHGASTTRHGSNLSDTVQQVSRERLNEYENTESFTANQINIKAYKCKKLKRDDTHLLDSLKQGTIEQRGTYENTESFNDSILNTPTYECLNTERDAKQLYDLIKQHTL